MINILFIIIAFIAGFFLGATAMALAAGSGRISAQEEGFEWGFEAGKKESQYGRCHWKYDDFEDKWDTGCGNAFVFIAGGLEENEMKFCPYCGYEIETEEIKNKIN